MFSPTFRMPSMHRVHEMLYADEDGALEHFQSFAIELLNNMHSYLRIVRRYFLE